MLGGLVVKRIISCCIDCEKSLSSGPRRGRCPGCYKRWRQINCPPNYSCDQCGNGFYKSPSSTTRFCSRSCWKTWKGRARAGDLVVDDENRVTLTCQHESCGKEFRVYPYEVKKGRRFCSLQCNGERRIIKPRTEQDLIGHWRQRVGFKKFAVAWIEENHECERCESEESLVVHHPRDPSFDLRLLFDLDNIEVLCRSCHASHHGN